MPGLPVVRNRVSFSRELRNAGGARTGANRAGLQTSVVLSPGKEFCVPPPAAVSRAHRDDGETSAVLPALRLAGRRQDHRNFETARTCGARPLAAASRHPFL